MKTFKIPLVFVLILSCVSGHAQWSNPDPQGKIYYNGGNVGINILDPLGAFHTAGVGSESWVYFGGNINGTGNPKNYQGLALGWNRTGGGGESSIVYNKSLGSNPRLDFSSFNGSSYDIEVSIWNGRLGVGTTSPMARFHTHEPQLLGAASGSSHLLRTISGRGSNLFMHNEWLVRDEESTTQWWTARLHDGISIDVSFLSPGQDTRTWWERDPHDNVQSWGDLDKTYMTLAGGNLGIGTESPSAKLEIRGPSIRLSDEDTRYLSISQDAQGKPFGRGWSNGYAGGRQFKLTGWSHLPDNSGSVQKDIVHFDGYNLLLLKDNGGSIGIGTSKPDALLTVKGVIHTTEVRVDLNVPGPDYVFEEQYDLPSLDDVRKYIHLHKHLPEIPSAKEMETNGIEVGQMNMLLLKKLEELTLYVLQLQEQNQKQDQIIQQLQTK